MKNLAWLLCRSFIEKRKKSSKELLFSFLPPFEKQIIQNLSPPSHDLTLGYDLQKDIFDSTHFSWLIPFLRSFSEMDACFFLSSLDSSTAQKLKVDLKHSLPLLPLSQTAQKYFKSKMSEFLILQTQDLLPIKALPGSHLNVLLKLSHSDLRFIIELLGLHDLAVELKQIIDNIKLKKIYALFPREKEAFLKMLAHKKEPVMFRRIEISRWNEESETLLPLLFERGLNRFAKALYPESKDLIWYIKHQLDMNDASKFSSLCKNLEHPKAYSFLSNQVLEAVSFLQKIKNNPPISS